MIITVGNTKGGVGKTTVALNIAISRALKKKSVWLIDGDRQQTAMAAIGIRNANSLEPTITCSALPDGESLLQQVQERGQQWDDIVVDAGGRDSSVLRAALVLSDILIVPFQPRSFDVWALEDIAPLIDEARAVPGNSLRCCAVLNCADPGEGMDNTDAAQAVKNIPQFEYLNAPLRRRKAFANSAGAGQGILEYRPKDSKAVAEFTALLKALKLK